MLILSRNQGESVICKLKDGDTIEFKILGYEYTSTKIGIGAPKSVVILRNELINKKGD